MTAVGLTLYVLARSLTAAPVSVSRTAARAAPLGQTKQCLCKGLTWPWIPHAGGMLPSVTIEYRNVEIEADALVGTSSVPSLTNAAWSFLKVPIQYYRSNARFSL